jgi:hypothetical protein
MPQFLFFCLLWLSPPPERPLRVPFFSDHFVISLPDHYKPPISQKSWTAPNLYAAFHLLDNTQPEAFIQHLQQFKTERQLNDWLFFLLVHATHAHAFPKATPAQIAVLNWFVLTRCGYDARLAYFESKVSLYLGTQSFLFEVPYLEEKQKRYVNVSAIVHPDTKDSQFYWPVYIDQPQPKSFSFELEQWPLLPPKPITQNFRFSFEGNPIEWSGQIDALPADIMARFPLLEEAAYLHIPTSAFTQNTLIAQIEQELKDKPLREKVSILASFTRSAFVYAEDIDQFGSNKPMTAEETLLYPASDCEDRVALFLQIAKNLIPAPMIAIAWPDHLSIGIAAPEIGGDFVRWKGKKYFICDPTGPENNSQIGIIPEDYREQAFEVIQFQPGKP